jgi:predicted kinase
VSTARGLNAAPVISSWRQRAGQLIYVHASPTCGKSTFVKRAFADDAVEVLDTDHYIENAWGWDAWRSLAREEASQCEIAIAHMMVGHGRRLLRDGSRVLLIGNLWGQQFLEVLADEDVDTSLSFFAQPDVIRRRSIERGGTPIPLDMAVAWFEAWAKYAPFRCKIALGERYLSDVLTPSGGLIIT